MAELTEEQRAALHKRWDSVLGAFDVDAILDQALAHHAADKAQSVLVYCNNWLLRDRRGRLQNPLMEEPEPPIEEPVSELQQLRMAVADLTRRVEQLAPTSHAKVTINAKREAQPEVNVYHRDPAVAVALCEAFIDHLALKYAGLQYIETDPANHPALPPGITIVVETAGEGGA